VSHKDAPERNTLSIGRAVEDEEDLDDVQAQPDQATGVAKPKPVRFHSAHPAGRLTSQSRGSKQVGFSSSTLRIWMCATKCCLGRHFIVAVLVFASSAYLAEAEFGGSCYDNFDLTPTTCEEVDELCGDNKCTTSSGGDMDYYCFDKVCSGSFTVPLAFQSACNAMNVTSCDDAESEFNSIGCSCFTCTEKDGKVEAECLYPYPCTPPQVPQVNDAITDAPELGSKEYVIVSAVYIAAAAVLAGSALAVQKYWFPNKMQKDPTIKEIIADRLTGEEDWWFFYIFSFAAVVEDDGSQMDFYDYFAAKGMFHWGAKLSGAKTVLTSYEYLFTSIYEGNKFGKAFCHKTTEKPVSSVPASSFESPSAPSPPEAPSPRRRRPRQRRPRQQLRVPVSSVPVGAFRSAPSASAPFPPGAAAPSRQHAPRQRTSIVTDR
jgi:hypothetical protein